MEDTLYILYCIVVSMFFGVNVQDAGGEWHDEGIVSPALLKGGQRRRRCLFITAP